MYDDKNLYHKRITVSKTLSCDKNLFNAVLRKTSVITAVNYHVDSPCEKKKGSLLILKEFCLSCFFFLSFFATFGQLFSKNSPF